jgi:mRNA interferase YafQ
MREIVDQSQFRKDFKKLKRSGRYDVNELLAIVEKLSTDSPLEQKHKDHQP